MLGVVIASQVRENSRALLDSKATIVVIDQDRDPTTGIPCQTMTVQPYKIMHSLGTKLGEPRFFLYILHNVDRLNHVIRLAICFLELLEHDAGFHAIGRLHTEQLEALVGDESGGCHG